MSRRRTAVADVPQSLPRRTKPPRPFAPFPFEEFAALSKLPRPALQAIIDQLFDHAIRGEAERIEKRRLADRLRKRAKAYRCDPEYLEIFREQNRELRAQRKREFLQALQRTREKGKGEKAKRQARAAGKRAQVPPRLPRRGSPTDDGSAP